ncbi:UDP-N-acetylmuramoyl-L-alanine--D-glutamate ligase [Magnetospirillum sp. UT-4]|uniref:UDP-N-acetylmuramoyl-L-alanine--D-glutamate ligase n=1 Tax=Magnetospirillum sp. UT-4 TaxID=2681467 RepID=UPI00137D1B06|nr:UDP-N-acetylmuramoyl-L-alanine--D-glutamate ligase [Magnetospirillum sp. UT-4]CAA7618515.1 UDP-N-acetylmuramoylalanine--D-glutamate ligase [Magnetospirillum sp. UT-4]
MIRVPFLDGKQVAVMGLGRSGTATARALLDSGAAVLAWDDSEAARAAAAEAGIPIADLMSADLSKVALMVWSPGIPHTHPEPHPVAERARAAGIELVCDVELLARARPGNRFVAVTGTNGKSTTTTLLAHVLAAGGLEVAAGGNLGTAALDLPELGEGGIYVLELSSYQLELVRSPTLAAAVLLNVTPDHLGRHGGLEGYVAAKRRLFDFLGPNGKAVIGIDDQHCTTIAQELLARGLDLAEISVEHYDAHVAAPDGTLRDEGREICDLAQLPQLPGRHNWQNACAVHAMASALGLAPETIVAGLATYPGLAHRQELVAEINGVRYVNDSKATNADAAEKALVCYENVHWIAGGQAKEGGIAALAPLFPRIARAYLIGEAAEQFAATLDGKVPFTVCHELVTALSAAHNRAAPGEVVLLSPACASWDQFRSFEHRGDTFRQLVRGLA